MTQKQTQSTGKRLVTRRKGAATGSDWPALHAGRLLERRRLLAGRKEPGDEAKRAKKGNTGHETIFFAALGVRC